MRKRVFATLLSMLLIFSYAPTITFATGMDMEAAAVETETDEEASSGELETEGETEISTEEITESQENSDTAPQEETEEVTEKPSSEEDAVMSLESEETTPLLGSSFSVAETEMETETETDEESETLCDHGNDAESCPVCDLEEQIAALPDLDEIQTMTGDEEETLYTQASALADVYYDDLTEDEQAQVSNIDTLWDVLDYFSSGLTLTALTAVSADTSWYNDTDTSFTITTAEQLAGLASLVNAGNDFSGKTITLGNSIDLNSGAWTPIGASSSYPFSGTFDGNGYTVSGLYIINSTGNCQGLFGAVKSGTVQNVTVNGSVTGTRYVGGIVGLTLLGATIKNCTNSATVSSGVNIGGVVGYNEESIVTNCINSGSVTSNVTTGYDYVGGVVGTNIGIVTNCINSGEVSGYRCVGGVVGYNIAALSYSYNSGTVSCTSQTAGGVVGYNNSNDVYKGSVSNCYYLSTTASAAYSTNSGTLTSVESKTTTEFASGEVAYLLNESVSGGTTWYQNIDNGKTVDSYPVLDSAHGTVYYGKNCNQVTAYSNTNLSATNGHVYETVVTDPTCTAGGYTTYTCSVCGDSYTADETEATGHSWNEGTVTTEATCTEDGVKTYTCTICGETKTETIEKTGHNYEAVITEATYTAQGYTTYTCTHCGDSYEADYTAVKVIDGTDGNLSTKTTVQELTAVPDGLKKLYSSVDVLVSDLIKRVIAVGTGYTKENALVYDVVLQYSTDGGTTWITATVDNFPADGITVTLPYPDGTDASYEFTVLHMFTVDSDRLGITAGDTESPTVTKTDDGLVFTLTGLSPVAVSWKVVTTSTTETDTSSQTDTTTESTNTSDISASSTTSAQTGDETNIFLGIVVMILAVGGITVTVICGRKRKYNR